MTHEIVFGRSESISADEIIRRLDVYSGDKTSGESWFEVHFGTSYLADGSSEVYGTEDGDLTSKSTLDELCPFDLPDAAATFFTQGNPVSVFWLIDAKQPSPEVIEGIQLIGPIMIDRFDFESQ